MRVMGDEQQGSGWDAWYAWWMRGCRRMLQWSGARVSCSVSWSCEHLRLQSAALRGSSVTLRVLPWPL